jgi:sortase A
MNGSVILSHESRRSRRNAKRTTTLWLVSGEILITAGILLGLFWVWYLFINDSIHASSQTQASEEVSEAWEDDALDGVVKIPNPQGLSIDPPIVEAVEAGEPFAILYVPRFGPDYQRTIAGGVDLATVLNDSRFGVGHYDESSLLGELGNFAIAGHRTSFGAIFDPHQLPSALF